MLHSCMFCFAAKSIDAAPLRRWPVAALAPRMESRKTMCEREERSLAAVAPTARSCAARSSSVRTASGSAHSTPSRYDTAVVPARSSWVTVCFLPARMQRIAFCWMFL